MKHAMFDWYYLVLLPHIAISCISKVHVLYYYLKVIVNETTTSWQYTNTLVLAGKNIVIVFLVFTPKREQGIVSPVLEQN